MTQVQSFGEEDFGHAQRGDKRRSKRLVDLADPMCLRPGGTLPQKFRSPADLQAFYRLMDRDDVTHEAILEAHRQAVFRRIEAQEGPVLILHDTTELEYTTRKSLTDLGQIGNGNRQGYLTHNSLAVVPLTRLQLRQASRSADAETRKATTIIGSSYVEVLSMWRHKSIKQDSTVHDSYYELARLGGHQNRKHDHPPGGQVQWEGWKELLPMVIGYDVVKSKYQRCGST